MPVNFAVRKLHLLSRSRYMYWFLPLLEPMQLRTNVTSLPLILLLASLNFLHNYHCNYTWCVTVYMINCHTVLHHIVY